MLSLKACKAFPELTCVIYISNEIGASYGDPNSKPCSPIFQ